MKAQQTVFMAVRDRGYTSGYSATQFLFRQLLKLIEELSEAVEIAGKAGGTIHDEWYLNYQHLQNRLKSSGMTAKYIFDNAPGMTFKTDDQRLSHLAEELADMQIVLFCAGEALSEVSGEPFDIIQAALDKSSADIARGVRGSSPARTSILDLEKKQ